MNPDRHQVIKRGMHQAMTCQTGELCESIRDDQQAIVASPTLRTGMPGMPGRVVDHFQANRRQRCESLLNDRDNAGSSTGGGRVGHAGRAFLNGLTVTVV